MLLLISLFVILYVLGSILELYVAPKNLVLALQLGWILLVFSILSLGYLIINSLISIF